MMKFLLLAFLCTIMVTSNAMQIFVEKPSGATITLEVEPSDYILDVKMQIEDREGLAVVQQRLFNNDVLLEDIYTLADYNIQPNTTLKLALTITYVNDDATGNNDGTTWADAFTSLQSALNVAVAGGAIWVAKGTYIPSSAYDLTDSPRYYHFRLIKGVAIYGGFAGSETAVNQRTNFRLGGANETILSGEIGTVGYSFDNCYHVIYCPDQVPAIDSTAILDGFTITAGNAGVSSSPHNKGGGIYLANSSPVFNNVIVTNNFANKYGGGIYCAGSTPQITNSIISNNSCSYMSSYDGWGGGIYISQSVMNTTPVKFTNVLISDNSAEYLGGGVFSQNSLDSYTNVTIVQNSALQGGGFYITGETVLNNCILWENSGSDGMQIYQSSPSSVITLNHTCYDNGTNDVFTSGTFNNANDNINTYPDFAGFGDEFRLYGNSPCLNKGDNSYNTTNTDLRGKDRIQNTTIDMGAYEWTLGIDPVKNLIVSNQSLNITDNLFYNNITVKSDGSLGINNGICLTALGNFIVESDAAGTGSFIDNGQLQVQGTISIEKYIDVANIYGTTVSSPVKTAGVSVFAGHINTYFYNPMTPGWQSFSAGNMDIMRGYWTKFNVATTLVFSDSINTGTKTDSVFYRTGFAAGNSGWNFVGNPYPSAIDWDLVIDENGGSSLFTNNTLLNNAVYIHKGDGSYASYIAGVGTGSFDGIIPSATGFWAHVNSSHINTSGPIAGAKLVFNNNMRLHQNQSGAKKNKANNIVRISISDNTYTDDAVIRLHQDASADFDPAFDAIKILSENENRPQIYSLLDNNDLLSINSISSNLTVPVSIPLGLSNLNNNLYSVSLAEMALPDNNISVYLEDIEETKMVDLRTTPLYNFTATSNTFNNRFVIHLNKISSAVESLSSPSNTSIYSYKNMIYITNIEEPCVITLYNMLGQRIYNKEIKARAHKVDLVLTAGYYIVKLTGNNYLQSQKVFVY